MHHPSPSPHQRSNEDDLRAMGRGRDEERMAEQPQPDGGAMLESPSPALSDHTAARAVQERFGDPGQEAIGLREGTEIRVAKAPDHYLKPKGRIVPQEPGGIEVGALRHPRSAAATASE